jgi:hypothetical protein
MNSGRRVATVAGIVAVVVALASPGVASADNSNTNTNNNDVTNIGDPSNMAPQSNGDTTWPPAGLSWPPNDTMNSGGENGRAAAPPIVLPTGEPAPTEAATANTSPLASKPIVPVNTS